MKDDRQDNIVWDKSHHSIFEDFALDLRDCTKTGKFPVYGGQDMNYCMELQLKRLRDKNLSMKYDIVPRGTFTNGGGRGRSWSDEHFISRMEYRSCRLTRTFYRDRKKIYDKSQDMVFYQIITNVHDSDARKEDLFTCPNCGAVIQIGALQEGCPYCGTFFDMADIFPKVTNFYFVEDFGGTKKEMVHSITKVILPCIAASMVGYSFYFYKVGKGIILSMIQGFFSGILFGVIGGYFLWAILQLGTLFKGAGKAMPMLINSAGSGKRFISQMKQHSPEFSYEYFSDKVVSILKMIIYTDNAQELPNYLGEPLGNMFSDIVEASYIGVVALKQFQVKNDRCYVIVDIYMEDVYDNGRRIYKKNDIIRMHLCKGLKKSIDYQFSIMKIQCKGCGGSFNAVKRRTCPSCGKRYEIEDDDWVVTKLQKR